ncbi:histo-blood group ABO system transferase isoform X2 [Ovis aries]|uniref:histo-blood group ABO system transferase isoform X2 n=1 Tax=Ovis aries TaxID=9940 RepID=UPI001C2ECC7D|nr:histo-blood group ABO system transferase isoform X2 [Ovis aries]
MQNPGSAGKWTARHLDASGAAHRAIHVPPSQSPAQFLGKEHQVLAVSDPALCRTSGLLQGRRMGAARGPVEVGTHDLSDWSSCEGRRDSHRADLVGARLRRWRRGSALLCSQAVGSCCCKCSNVFNLIPRRQTEESQSLEAHHLQGQREGLPLSQGENGVVLQRLLLEKKESNEGDGHLDTCRIPEVPRLLYPKAQLLKPSRVDVLVMTPWFAPIIWDGTFDSAILDAQFRDTTIGLTVFAIKKYVVFLRLFLETAEKYFMVGHKVTYYVFTDRPADVPQIALRAGRQVVVLHVGSYRRWQDISMHRMEMISNFSRQRFLHEVDYLVCLDVDMKFSDHVGVEILAPLFGTLHPVFYAADRQSFTYERRPLSRAYIPRDEGDFYYAGGFFGGSVPEVYRLTTACHQAMAADQAQGIEAIWHDESHLNRYLLSHKPSKVLSPEYLWDEQMLQRPPLLRKLRYVAVPKNHGEIRNR